MSYRIISYRIISYHIISYHIISYHISQRFNFGINRKVSSCLERKQYGTGIPPAFCYPKNGAFGVTNKSELYFKLCSDFIGNRVFPNFQWFMIMHWWFIGEKRPTSALVGRISHKQCFPFTKKIVKRCSEAWMVDRSYSQTKHQHCVGRMRVLECSSSYYVQQPLCWNRLNPAGTAELLKKVITLQTKLLNL